MSGYHIGAVQHALEAKGFVRKAGDHRRFRLHVDGIRSEITTRFSHGDRRIEEGRLRQIARQCALSVKEMRSLIECGLSGQGYVDLLRQRGVL